MSIGLGFKLSLWPPSGGEHRLPANSGGKSSGIAVTCAAWKCAWPHGSVSQKGIRFFVQLSRKHIRTSGIVNGTASARRELSRLE